MGGTGNHNELAFAGNRGACSSIQVQNHLIASAHDQQRRRVDFGQGFTGEIRPAAAGDYGMHGGGIPGFGSSSPTISIPARLAK